MLLRTGYGKIICGGEPHKAAKKCKEQEEAKERGESYRVEVPVDAPILQGMKRMRETECRGVQKLFDIAYYIAAQGRPLSDYESLLSLQKLHGVEFMGTSYESRFACRRFLLSISDYFLEKNVQDKLSRCNFIAIMTDGTTDAAVSEQEVIYLSYLDPDEFEPRTTFFRLQQLHGGQDADILMNAIRDAFQINGMTNEFQKLVFFGSDGTNTNSGLKTGLITKLKNEIPWIQFIWCISHRLELSMKDALEKFINPVDESLRHLYYLFKKSSKKLSQLKSLKKDLEKIYDFETKSLRPEKSTDTRWLDHKLRAMKKLIDKFGVYVKQIENSIEQSKTSSDKATLQGKLNGLTNAAVLLRSAFLSDILQPAKIISLVSQKASSDIIATTDSIKHGKEKYQRWKKRFTTNPEKIFELSSLKTVLEKIDEEHCYQGVHLKYFQREKQYIQDWAPSISRWAQNSYAQPCMTADTLPLKPTH